MMEDKNININMSGGQFISVKDNGIVYATQNNGVDINRLDSILKEIRRNLSDVEKEDADNIRDVIDMVEDELMKPEPKVSRLRNCVTLIAPMLTIANGIPDLSRNLQNLVDIIMSFIH